MPSEPKFDKGTHVRYIGNYFDDRTRAADWVVHAYHGNGAYAIHRHDHPWDWKFVGEEELINAEQAQRS
jgi:hypothetical protein